MLFQDAQSSSEAARAARLFVGHIAKQDKKYTGQVALLRYEVSGIGLAPFRLLAKLILKIYVAMR